MPCSDGFSARTATGWIGLIGATNLTSRTRFIARKRPREPGTKGRYRVLYSISGKKLVVIILKIGHRKDVHR